MRRLFIALSLFSLIGILLGGCGQPGAKPSGTAVKASLSPSPSPSFTPTNKPTKTATPKPGDMTQTFILSMDDNGYSHLFAYVPSHLTPVRLTNGQWDDLSPATNRDGTKVVFASNRNAYWDLYVLNLATGQTTRITDTPEYDGNPAWSPDDQWIIYETLVGDQMDINIRSTSDTGRKIELTNDTAFDQQPAWSPQGRQVAFASNRSGDNQIWVVDLDKPDASHFVNVSRMPGSSNTRPSWSPDGSKLAWAGHTNGQPDSIYIWDAAHPDQPARRLGAGDWPAWNDGGDQIATRVKGPNQDYLVSYALDGSLTMPLTPVHDLRGLDWKMERPNSLTVTFYQQAVLTPTALMQRQTQPAEEAPGKRASVVKLDNVDAPHPYLQDTVNEAFQALRDRIIKDTGWDALASLENAYTPLTSALDPGKGQDWLYTGRAFAINPLILNAGWMAVMREEIDGRTYWRVFLRTVAQDGSEGEPLRTLPWDLTSRYNMDPSAYDQGGSYANSIPAGYWVDLTAIAHKFGWERVAALDNWRTYFGGAQFNEFVMSDGLDWHTAMLELYPGDIFITPTVVVPPTRTPTATPRWYYYKTPTPTLTFTPTMRPTYTPAP